MRLDDLFFNSNLQEIIIGDLERDVARLKDVPPGLMGTNSTPLEMKQTPTTINGFFAGSEPEGDGVPRSLCNDCNFDCLKDGPEWGRIWIMLILILVSPRLAASVMNEPGDIGKEQRVWLEGKRSGFLLQPFSRRMTQMMCGDAISANAMTPIEIVTRELYNLRLIQGC